MISPLPNLRRLATSTRLCERPQLALHDLPPALAGVDDHARRALVGMHAREDLEQAAGLVVDTANGALWGGGRGGAKQRLDPGEVVCAGKGR